MAKPLTAEQAIFLVAEPLMRAESGASREESGARSGPADKPDYRLIQRQDRHGLCAHRGSGEPISGNHRQREFNPTAGGIPDNVKTPAKFAGVYADPIEKNCEALSKLSADQLLKIRLRGMFQRPAYFLAIGYTSSASHWTMASAFPNYAALFQQASGLILFISSQRLSTK